MSIQLGDTVRDQITGFEGVTTGRAEYLTGCVQFIVQPPLKDGKFEEGRWFDEDRLEVMSRRPAGLLEQRRRDGGPAGSAPVK
jgi:hypothetical protein